MAEEAKENQDEEAGSEASEDGAEGPRKRRLPGRKLAIMVGAPVLVVLIGAGAWFGGLLGGGDPSSAEAAAPKQSVFVELPEMVVNLADHGEERARFLKLQVSLELPDQESRAALEPVLPRVVDLFQVYLRELRSSDLEGSAGIYRLKEELVRRVSVEIEPHSVNDVLFKEIILQ